MPGTPLKDMLTPATADYVSPRAKAAAMQRAAVRGAESSADYRRATSKTSAVRPVSTLQKVRSLFGGRR